MNIKKNFVRALLTIVSLLFLTASISAQSSGFNYQGRLNDSSTVTGNGSYLFKFELFDAAENGNLIDTLTNVPVTVTNNVFSVNLNFTAQNAFNGGTRFLQISLKPSNAPQDATFTTLSPRQQIGTVPYAVHAQTGTTSAEVTQQIQTLTQNTQTLTTQVTALMAQVTALQADSAPIGTIMAFGGPIGKIPAGWAHCDGTLLTKNANNQALFDAIGVAWGSNDSGTTTFRLPDLRGRFLRGLDSFTGRDPDRNSRTADYTGQNTGHNVGSVQSDAFASHNHSTNLHWLASIVDGNPNTGWAGRQGPLLGLSETSTNTGGNETRPKNAAVLYIIRVK